MWRSWPGGLGHYKSGAMRRSVKVATAPSTKRNVKVFPRRAHVPVPVRFDTNSSAAVVRDGGQPTAVIVRQGSITNRFLENAIARSITLHPTGTDARLKPPLTNSVATSRRLEREALV